jgi:hypothetical protein
MPEAGEPVLAGGFVCRSRSHSFADAYLVLFHAWRQNEATLTVLVWHCPIDNPPGYGFPDAWLAGLRHPPDTDILGRRPKDKPSIGPIEPQKGDAPFMNKWTAYFQEMQADVQPPDPNAAK